jgi:hypothetical protein
MPVINASTLETGNLKGADHGATVSLILDHSEPCHGPRLHRHPYDETWVVVEGNLTFQPAATTTTRDRGTLSSPRLACRTSSQTMGPGAATWCASTPARP